LLVDGEAKVNGFSHILSYLQRQNSGRWDPDGQLTHEQVTNGTALVFRPHTLQCHSYFEPRFAAFLESTAGPLADLSLYISSENYHSITSSAYTAILPWYLNYTIPPRRREIARSRTAHLGLSTLEIPTAEQNGPKPGSGTLSSEFETAKRDAGMPTQAPVLNMGRKSGIQGLLSSPVYAARFKLDALSNGLLEPLEHLLQKNQYLLGGDEPSSLDFRAFGYLALMLYPQVPQAWLRDAMHARFPRVVDYIGHMRRVTITVRDTKPSDVWVISHSRDGRDIESTVSKLGLHLPWRPIPPRSLSSAVTTIARQITGNLPLLSAVYEEEQVVQGDRPNISRRVASTLPSQMSGNALSAASAAAVAALAAMAIMHRRSPREGNLIFWALRPRAEGLGEAGNILSVLTGQMAMPMGL
jgi:sorting and assembly machinery component 37